MLLASRVPNQTGTRTCVCVTVTQDTRLSNRENSRGRQGGHPYFNYFSQNWPTCVADKNPANTTTTVRLLQAPIHSCNKINNMRSLPLCYLRKEPSLLSLAKHRKFDEIVGKLEDKDSGELSSWLGVLPNGSFGIDHDNTAICSLALHQIMIHRPPANVVEMMIKKMKQVRSGYIPEAAVDEKNQTALHIAVEIGCGISVIKCLTATSDLPAFTMDTVGRFPLHIACCLSPRRGRGMIENTEQIINHLLEVYPQAAIVPDLTGKTPLQLLLGRGVSSSERRIVLTLRMVEQILSKESTPSVARTSTSTADELSELQNLVSNYIFISIASMKENDDMSSVGSRGVSQSRPQRSYPAVEVQYCQV
jgi:hypothetical protein